MHRRLDEHIYPTIRVTFTVFPNEEFMCHIEHRHAHTSLLGSEANILAFRVGGHCEYEG
jgi:hypothetical protein